MADLPSTHMQKVGERLAELREAFDLGPSLFADFVGISRTTWSNYEAGKRRISLDEALKVKAKTGVSTDWIYQGDEAFLPNHIAQKIIRLRAATASKRSA